MSDTRRGGAEIVRVIERSGDPAPEADRVILYAKDVIGVTQLFALASDGSVSQVSAITGTMIGGPVGGGPTAGSALFIGAGGILAQNNANFFWDNTNFRLGIGNASPGISLDIGGTGTAAALAMRAGSTAPVSAANTGRFRYNESTQKMQISSNGAAYADIAAGASIGGSISGGTTGSVLFVGAGATFAQDNARLNWDSSVTRLLVASSHATDGPLMVKGATATTPSALGALDNSGGFHSYWGYFNASYGFAYMASKNGVLATDNSNIVFGNSTQSCVEFGMVTDTIFVELARGNSSAVSSANAGRFRYNQATQKMQLSNNGGAYSDLSLGSGASIGGGISGGTTGSVLFVGAGSTFAQDNPNFFWDATNFRLGIGNGAPSTTLDVTGNVKITHSGAVALNAITTFANDVVLWIRNLSATGYSSTAFFDSSNTFQGYFGYSNSGAAVGPGHFNFYSISGDNWQFWNSVDNVAAITVVSSGAATTKIQYANGSSAAVSASNTGAIRYNTTGQKFQISANGAAYADLVTGSGMAIGGTVTGSTVGSVLFVGASNLLAQDNADFFWDNTNKRLGINAGTTPSYVLDARGSLGASLWGNINTDVTGNSAIDFYKNDVTFEGSVGYANASSATATHVRGFLYHWSVGPDWIFANGSQAEFRLGMTHSQAFLEMGDGSNSAVSGADKGRLIYYDSGVPSFLGSYNGSAYFYLLDSATQMTSGSVVFATSGGHLAQNNANFFWNNTTHNLEIGASAVTQNFTTFPLTVSVGSTDVVAYMWNTNVAGYSALGFLDSALTYRAIFGYGNSSTTNGFTNHAFVDCNAVDFAIIDGATGAAQHLFGTTDGAIFYQMKNGSGAAVSASNTGRIIYNTTGQKFQTSANGAAYLDTALMAAALTTGSVPFSDASGHLAQDNARLFWDNTNHRLGIGTATPGFSLSVFSAVSGGSTIEARATVTDGYSSLYISDSTGAQVALIGYGNSTVSATALRLKNFFFSAGNQDWVFSDSTGGNVAAVAVVPNSVSWTMTNGSGAAVSAANTGKLIYTTTGQKFQVSLNTAAYVDLLTSSTGALQTTTLTAGNGLTGGGDLSANRTFDVGAGTGILSNANDVAVDQSFAFAWTSAQSWKAHAAFTGSAQFLTTTAVQTTDATQNDLTIFTIPDTTASWITVEVVGRDAAGVERAIYGKAALVYREGGGATIQGTVQDLHPDVETSAGLDATITVSGNNVRVSVTGLAATTINWVATARYQAVSSNT